MLRRVQASGNHDSKTFRRDIRHAAVVVLTRTTTCGYPISLEIMLQKHQNRINQLNHCGAFSLHCGCAYFRSKRSVLATILIDCDSLLIDIYFISYKI